MFNTSYFSVRNNVQRWTLIWAADIWNMIPKMECFWLQLVWLFFKVFMTIFLTKVAKITGDSLGYFQKCLFKSKLQSMGQIFDTIRLSSGHTDCIKNTSKGVKTLLRTHPYKKPSIEVQLLYRIDTSFSLIKGYGKS